MTPMHVSDENGAILKHQVCLSAQDLRRVARVRVRWGGLALAFN